MKSPLSRRSTRLHGHDYSVPGAYFVTICTYRKECLFGDVVADAMRLSALGEIAARIWQTIPNHVSHVELGTFVVMPNHIHGILVLRESVGAKHASPLRHQLKGSRRGSVSAIVQAFKSAVSREARLQGFVSGEPLWQRGFHDHIARTNEELTRVRLYIEENPLRWSLDAENPDRRAP